MTFSLKIKTAAECAAERRIALQSAVSAARNTAVDAGTDVNGMQVHTDDTSQGRIVGAALTASLDPNYSVQWKTIGGTFVTLSAPEILAAAQAVRAHVQRCFDAEAVVLAQVAALPDSDLAAFDVSAAYAVALAGQA